MHYRADDTETATIQRAEELMTGVLVFDMNTELIIVITVVSRDGTSTSTRASSFLPLQQPQPQPQRRRLSSIDSHGSRADIIRSTNVGHLLTPHLPLPSENYYRGYLPRT